MRIKVREIIDIDSPNIKDMTPMQRVSVAFRVWWRKGKIYQYNRNKRLEQEFREKSRKEESLKEELLNQLHAQLIQNSVMRERGLVCETVELAVARSEEKILREVIGHKELIEFNCEILEPNKDMLRSFPSIPIIVRASRKVLGGDDF